jgi:hypothetical protein
MLDFLGVVRKVDGIAAVGFGFEGGESISGEGLISRADVNGRCP